MATMSNNLQKNTKVNTFHNLFTSLSSNYSQGDESKVTQHNSHLIFFSVRLLSVLRGHSVFSSPPKTANDLRLWRISIPDLIHYFLILILEKEPVFPFSLLSAKQGNYWYHFITSLVWRGPWLGIEPGTSRTRSQHYTIRLSRRQYQ